jgi:hypothetical protein
MMNRNFDALTFFMSHKFTKTHYICSKKLRGLRNMTKFYMGVLVALTICGICFSTLLISAIADGKVRVTVGKFLEISGK